MFSRTIWCLIACVLAESIKSVSSTEMSIPEKQKDVQFFKNKSLSSNFFEGKSSETKTKKANITKRGIVLVDEDFDVPSAIYKHENRSGSNMNARSDMFDRNEGSGNEELDENKLDKTSVSDTHPPTDSSSISADLTKGVKSTEDTSLLTVSSISPELTKGMKPTEAKDILLLSDSSISSELTKGMQSTQGMDILLLNDSDSSGDDILITKEYSTTELTTKTHTKTVHEFQDVIPEICLNTNCSQDDLYVTGTKKSSSVPESTNVTLTCKSNNSDHHILYWYKSNGTVHFLQILGTEEELLFNIPDAKSFHTGGYLCVKWVDTHTCCNLKTYLSVYELPKYKYHIMILAIIVVVGLILCIVLTVRRTVTLKNYTKQFIERHGKINQLL